jgi:hypothetical protein
MHKGSCLCGAVTFEVSGELQDPTACHCSQCRKHSGHFEASTDIPRASLKMYGENFLTWFHTPTKNVRRGFCSVCGSSLFWDPIGRDWTSVAMGAFDTPTKTKLKMHVHVASKGDYYELSDGLPQFEPPK